tara:strand:- start:32 stop:301 length:270 start_codon:yes stop_codon:yes gene_type:complete
MTETEEELHICDFPTFETEAEAQMHFDGMIEKMKRGNLIYFDEHRYLPMEKKFQNYLRKWLHSHLHEGWEFSSYPSRWGSIRCCVLKKL